MIPTRRNLSALLPLLWFLWATTTIYADNAIAPVSTATPCAVHKCGPATIPYPFGLPGCGQLAPFSLACTGDALFLPLNSKQYKVLNFTDKTIVVDPRTNLTSCDDPNFLTFNLTGFPTFWASPRNTLVLYACKQPARACPRQCPFPVPVGGANQTVCSANPCCYSLNSNNTALWKSGSAAAAAAALGCDGFTSWVVDSHGGREIDATYGLELEWSIPGRCAPGICARNASCVAGRDDAGHTCRCDDGFQGDGYWAGIGCTTAMLPVCNATLLVNCTCKAPVRDGLCGDHHSISLGVLVAAGIAAGGTVIVAVFLIYLGVRWQGARARARGRRRETRELARLFSLGKGANTTTFFTYKELGRATKGFAVEKKVGGGAFGTVYAGKLPDGKLIAVKAINASNTRGIEQVVNEVTVLSSVNHTNLVQLLGCCLEAKDPLLVYEFVENGTLAEHLQRERGGCLDWAKRIRIATETAGALAYLHSVIQPPIYHRDVKSTNILLDANFTTKVADFGLSRTILTEGSHVSTVPQGTPGYLDPEYHQYFHLSDKSDVYSFGVVLIEIITAMKVVDFSRDRREVNLAALALSKITSGCLDDIIDPCLEAGKYPRVRAMVHRVAELAFRCLASDKDARPGMLEVADELTLVQLTSLDSPLDEPLACVNHSGGKAPKPAAAVSPTSVHQPWPSAGTSPADSVPTA